MTDLATWGADDTRRLRPADFPAAILPAVVERDGPGCYLCNRLGLVPPADEPLELDHLVPLARGGDNHLSNLQLLCRSHNRGRADRPPALDRPPAWLLRLSRRGELARHVERSGSSWCPAPGRLRAQIRALLGGAQ